jgi:hypothetical protein
MPGGDGCSPATGCRPATRNACVEAMPFILANKENDHAVAGRHRIRPPAGPMVSSTPVGATFPIRRRNARQRPDAGGPAPSRGLLFRPIYLQFPRCKFRCYFHKIPLFPKTAVGPQAIEIAGRPGGGGLGFFKNSLLIPLLPQIAKRFQRDGASSREAGSRHGYRLVMPALVAGIHAFLAAPGRVRRGWPGRARP